MVSQFKSTHQVPLLGDIDFDFPEGTHAIGRLDSTSEGLLILTTDKTVTRKLFLATEPHPRSYLVMVQNNMSAATIAHLQNGVAIPIKNGALYIAKPISAFVVENPCSYYPYANDHRNQYPHTWLLITLTEGKFRQVRKMVQALRHRCLRLVRLNICNIYLGDLAPGAVRELDEKTFYDLLAPPQKIPNS